MVALTRDRQTTCTAAVVGTAVLSVVIATLLLMVAVSSPSLQKEPRRLAKDEFGALMNRLADAWSRQDTKQAVSCFAPDAIYMEPPDKQLYRGHWQLGPYFAALRPGTFMVFHRVSLDESKQVGFGEFSFGRTGAKTADHGVAVVELRDGRIRLWREYVQPGPAAFETFVAIEGKSWKWTIENYQ